MATTPKPKAIKKGQAGGKNTAYTMQRRLLAAKAHEYQLVTNFNENGYRNREDITMLPAGVMVQGSYNVLTNVSNRIGVTKGYTLDGQSDNTITSINSSYDFTKVLSNDRHVRSQLTKLQFRYEHPVTAVIRWLDVVDGLANSHFNYCQYWDNDEQTTVLLFVNGTSNIYEWSGAVTSYASSTSNTITKSGTTTWIQEGFYVAGTRNVIINDVIYNYTGGEDTLTLTGVSPDPTGAGIVVGDAVIQEIRVTPNASMTTINPDFNNALIANLNNQIFIGALNSSIIFTSKVNDYKNYSNDDPRLIGQGATTTIGDYPTSFINQEDNIYVSAGKDLWYRTLFTDTTTSVDDGSGGIISTVYQTLTYSQLKTTPLQSAQSQAVTTKIKNDIVFLSFEPIINSLGRVENVLLTPQVTDLSYPIVNDMNRYDWTDAAMIYFRQYLYVTVPKEGIIRIYNMTQPKSIYWESPITYPIGRFSIIDDELYGHGYNVPETYKLLDGYTFNGDPIPAAIYFSYNQYGTRTKPKDFNLFYLEGYITSNCTLNYGLNFDIDGCQTQRIYSIDGGNNQLVCSILPDASLGKAPLGSRPFSGFTISPSIVSSTDTGLPPKFRAIKQLSKFPFYELQVFFTSLGTNQQWELISFGPNVSPATEGTNPIQY